MNVRFWGVRGSSPTPLSSEQIKNKISSVVQRIRTEDLKSQERRDLFLSTLPPDLFGTVGGNTACIEVRTDDNKLLILDCWTGLRELERRIKRRRDPVREFHIFFSHFHYDHLIGLPFFSLLYEPGSKVHFYSPYPKMEKILRDFMDKPYHPVPLNSFAAEMTFHVLKDHPVKIGNSKVDWIKRHHPNGSFAYKVSNNSHSIIYSSDTELQEQDFIRTERNLDFFKKADMIILDAQYTLGEAIEKYDWGHSSYSMAVDFSLDFEISQLYLFHHEPLYNDYRMEEILRSAKWYYSRHNKKSLPLMIDLAREGLDISF